MLNYPEDAPKHHVPHLEQWAYNQMPKTSDWRNLHLMNYTGTNLYQWYGCQNGSIFVDAFAVPFLGTPIV